MIYVTKVIQVIWHESRSHTWRRTRSRKNVTQIMWCESRSMKCITWCTSRSVNLWLGSYDASHESWRGVWVDRVTELSLHTWPGAHNLTNPGKHDRGTKERNQKPHNTTKRKSNTTQERKRGGVSYPHACISVHTHLSRLWVKSRCILNDWLLRYEYRQRKEKHEPTT